MKDSKSPEKSKEHRINVRVDPAMKRALQEVASESGYTETALVEHCLKALIEHYKHYGHVILPLEIFPKGLESLREYVNTMEMELTMYEAVPPPEKSPPRQSGSAG